MSYSEGYSLADIAAATGNNSNDGFGNGSGAWLIILFLIFAAFGWGGNRGYGFGGVSGSEGAANNYVLASDFATLQRQMSDGFGTLERKGDAINTGLCDGFYAQNTNLLNGFAGVNQSIANGVSGIQSTLCQGFSGINTGMVQQGYENRIAINGVNTQLSQCCCDLKGLVAENKYENAQNVNALNNNINAGFVGVQNSMCMNTRDIISSQEAGTRAILDAITANRIEDKNAQITAQQNEINALRLAASQSAQNEYLLNSLRNGCPVNAQLVCGNQPIPVQYIGANGCNCNNSCGC